LWLDLFHVTIGLKMRDEVVHQKCDMLAFKGKTARGAVGVGSSKSD